MHDLDGGGDSLTELGWKQAEQLGKRLEKRSFSGIYVSAMRRAQETAAAINEYVDAPIRFFPEIHEIYRGSEELALETLPERRECYVQFFKQMAKRAADSPFKDGESFQEIVDRGTLLLDTLKQNKSGSEAVLVVTHGGLLRFLLGISILGDSFTPRQIGNFMDIATINTGISEFELTDEQFRLITWMDQAHL